MPCFMQYTGKYPQLNALSDKTFEMNRHVEDKGLGLPADHGTKFNAHSLSQESKLKFRKVLKNRQHVLNSQISMDAIFNSIPKPDTAE